MKRDKILSRLIAGTLAFLLSYSGLGCLVSGFGLDGANMVILALVCGLFSFGGAVLAGGKWGPWLSAGILGLGLFLLLRSKDAREQLWYLLYHISDFYHRAYGWLLLRLGESGPDSAGAVTYPLGLLGGLVAVLVSYGVVRRKSALPGALIALLPLFTCLVVTDTVPGAGWLYLLILALLLLILTAGQRRDSEEQGNSLALMAVVPTAIALGILFWAIPKESYVNKTQAFYDEILTWAEKYPALMEELTGGSTSGAESDPQVDLRSTGPLLQRQYPVMDVSAPVSGTMYLRGQDYDVYDGTGWTATAHRAEFLSGNEQLLEEQGTVTVATLSGRELCYVPYYAAGGIKLLGGVAKNPQFTTAYGFAQKTLPENWRELLEADAPITWSASGMDSRYLDLPEDTRIWAEELLGTVLPEPEGMIATDKAEIIAGYVRASAQYDTDTPKMPLNRRDFVRWFLEESDTGYCVHFASATAVLLRAAGVPARYVTGYMFQAEAGTPVTVREYQAHAWVEYYEDRLGMWLVVESTPAALDAPGVSDPTQTQTQPTSAQETTEATMPEAPEVTRPQESTPGHREPVSGNADGDDGWKLPDWVKTLGGILLWLAMLSAALSGQRQLRLHLRRSNAGTGSNNRRALARWRELELLYRRLGQQPPEELEALAQKARFSQHHLTVRELQVLDAGLRTARGLCRKKPWYQKLIDQYIYAAY